LGQEFLRGLFQRPEIALACAAAVGLPIDHVGQGFACILPGHEEVHPSASLYWDPKTGALQYHDWHARSGEPWYTLLDVRASLACRQAVRLRGPSVATWQLGMLVEAAPRALSRAGPWPSAGHAPCRPHGVRGLSVAAGL
jgi:hypothetical protein